MKIDFQCYDCIFKLFLELSNELGKSSEERKALCNEFLEALVATVREDGTPPEVMAKVWCEIRFKASGVCDPMAEIKHNSTRIALDLLPKLRNLAAQSANPFETAVKLAISGNIIDFGIDRNFDLSSVERRIEEAINAPADKLAIAELKKQMDQARSILYILDNCGEAVFDRLLMEPYAGKLTVGVRGKPVLNDVTPAEALESGIDFAPVIDTGDGTAGVSLRRSKPEFLQKLRSADLIVAKGQGNFESLEHLLDRPVFYLFRAKCPVICELLNAKLNSLQIIGRNLK